MNSPKNENLSQYKTLGLNLLQLMGVVMVIGVILASVLRYFY